MKDSKKQEIGNSAKEISIFCHYMVLNSHVFYSDSSAYKLRIFPLLKYWKCIMSTLNFLTPVLAFLMRLCICCWSSTRASLPFQQTAPAHLTVNCFKPDFFADELFDHQLFLPANPASYTAHRNFLMLTRVHILTFGLFKLNSRIFLGSFNMF